MGKSITETKDSGVRETASEMVPRNVRESMVAPVENT